MHVRDDLNRLPLPVKRSIARFVRKLLREHQDIHTIVIDRAAGIKSAQQFTDFELFVLCSTESEKEKKQLRSESGNGGSFRADSVKGKICSPGGPYQKSEPVIHPDDCKALIYRFPLIYKRKESAFREFLRDHMNYFTINDYMNITMINSPEMEKSNPVFYPLFTTYRFDKGHVIYNSLGKPYVTMHSLEDLK